MPRERRSSKRGRMRWVASAVSALLLLAWLLSAWWLELAAAGSLGRLSLRSGRLVIAYQLHPTLPPNFQVTTILDWPSPAEYGVRFLPLRERGIRWGSYWPADDKMNIEMGGGSYSYGLGPSPIARVGAASFYTEKMLPLWPVVLASLVAAAWSWRRHLRPFGPGECGRCGYSRGGLVENAACPECGTVPARG